MKKSGLLLLFVLCALFSISQDTIIIGKSSSVLNHSHANVFHLFSFENKISFNEFLAKKSDSKPRRLKAEVENLDFTTGTYFIDFVISNETNEDLELVLETARPITNVVELLELSTSKISKTGDGIHFDEKDIYQNSSVLPLKVSANECQRFILKLGSDGEIISLPMILWQKDVHQKEASKRHFFVGIFYGIFAFVIVIYLTFYYQLKDRLFLLYSFYVLFSGLLQFALDGYLHQFIFTGGGYFTQHSVLFIAGIVSVLALQYAQRYLDLQGRTKKLTQIFSGTILVTILASLIPGKIYEISYPLINGFSLIGVVFLLFVAFKLRREEQKISTLFFVGLFMLLGGAVIFILGNFSVINAPGLTQNALKFGTLIEIICLSILMAGKYRLLQQEKELAQKQLLSELAEKNKIAEEANVKLEAEVKARTAEIEEQRELLKEKNEDLVGSIKYAERIQKALLSNEDKFKNILPNSFIYFRPKDIVSGDFYWIDKIDPTTEYPSGLIVYATADCTGHGVPGAFVSIICNNLLKLGKTEKSVQTPGDALDFINREINEVLNSNYGEEQIRDGMDIALCALDPHAKKLYFSGAKNGVVIVRNGEIIELKGDRRAIGYSDSEDGTTFKTQELDLMENDMLYTFSDGYVDQFGGPDHKKFMIKRLKEMLVTISTKSMTEQLEIVDNTFDIWKEGVPQIDDVLLIGVKVNRV